MISDRRLELGLFEDDLIDEKAFREAVLLRIQQKRPIFPNRRLKMEYAAVNHGPRGIPIAEVALANLRPGDRIITSPNYAYSVIAIGKTLKLEKKMADGTSTQFRLSPDSERFGTFVRDVDGALTAAAHGFDAGDLIAAWKRDPISAQLSTVSTNSQTTC